MYRTSLLWIGSCCWLCATAVPLVYWHGWHATPLPAAENAALGDAARPLAPGQGPQRFHVLQMGCPCSNRLADYLRQRVPEPDETIVLIDGDGDHVQVWLALRWRTQRVTDVDTRRRWGISGGPWLVVMEHEHIRYRGGYADRRPSSAAMVEDKNILNQVQAGNAMQPYPTYGCSFSEEWLETYDPFGLKWSKQ